MWLRVHNRFLSRCIAASLAVLVCGGAVDWGHVGGDDRDCEIVVTHHDHTAHRFSTATVTSSPTDHCYICHSLRLLHQAVTSRYERVAVALQTARRVGSDVITVCDGLRVGIASRAPPAVRL